ncbi:MAG: Rne/Rng family ribonuclease [Mailhella sp.]|nr:Rne/Rng family ribonuclease [Mailhella sp.]
MSQTPALPEEISEEKKTVRTRRSRKAADSPEQAADAPEKKTVRRTRKTAAAEDLPEEKTAPRRTRKTAKAAESSDEGQKKPVRRRTARRKADESGDDVIISLGSALVLDDTLPPAAMQHDDDAAEEESAKAPVKRRTRRKETAPAPEENASAHEASPAEASAEAMNAEPGASADGDSGNGSESAVAADAPQATADTADEASPRRNRRSRSRSRKNPQEAAPDAEQAPAAEEGADELHAAPEADDAPDLNRAFFDDGIVSSILPYAEEPQQPSSGRNRRKGRKNGRDAQPAFGDSAFMGDPYGQDYFPGAVQPQNRPFGDRKSRAGKKNRRGRQQGQPYPGDAYEFDPAALNDSILGAAFADPSDFTSEDGFLSGEIPGSIRTDAEPAPEADSAGSLDGAMAEDHADSQHPSEKDGKRQNGRKNRKQKDKDAEDKSASQEKPKGASAEDEAASGKTKGPRRVLYISVIPNEQSEVVITEDGQVSEYFVEMAHQAKIRGNIYKGVINNIDTNLQAAFINYGNGKNGFLQIDEVHPEYYLVPHDSSSGSQYPLIQKVLKVGQEVLVQVVKEPAGTKGAFLTTWISIAGRFLVLTPGQEQTGVSRKVTDHEERDRLKDLLKGIQAEENMGVIIRTASEGANPESIGKDLAYLQNLWKDIRRKAATEKSPSLIYQEADLAGRAVRDYMSEDIVEIWTDDESVKKRIEGIIDLNFPDHPKDMIKLHRDARQTLLERFNLLKQLDTITSREVVLPSGGRLVFDQTEALMAIDINSGKTQGKSNFEAMVFRTNTEAAEAIARHLRLRDIGGQVVIDFIEMRDKSHCRDVERTLRNAMRKDRARHDIGHMSSFGLLELVRQRIGTSAISISSEPCPYCHGTGVRRNMEWQALKALRDLQAKLSKTVDSMKGKKNENRTEPPVFTYECEPELAMYVLNRKRERLSELEEQFGARIEIHIK